MSKNYSSKIGPIKPGAERKELGLSQKKPMPTGLNQTIVNKKVGSTIQVNGKPITVTPKLKQRAQFAENMRKK